MDKQYSDETEKERCKLRLILNCAKKHDDYKGKCRMDGGNLVIKGRNYNTQNLHLFPVEINGYNATSKTDDATLGFFGKLNPLSNFHRTPFNINGNKYHSSEQFIQQQKCIIFNDKNTESRIMVAETPLECKLIAKDIKNYDHERWKQVAKETCTLGILAKFEQNPALAGLLRSTGSKRLVECCKDKDWGTCIPLFVENSLDSSKWHGQGLLGEILETVCQVIQNNLLEDTETAMVT